jgi:hypothetical protein
MSKLSKAGLFALTWLVLIPASVWAQGSITGLVKDTSGAVLPGVTVEAASPVLIEKVRSVVTDGTGQYRIVNLRPGTYSVTFSLTGFGTVKREGIELTGSFTATVNVDLAVGTRTETVTVTGESPIVDVQGTLQQRVMQKDIIDAIPAGRSHQEIAVLIPGVSGGAPDVGGSNTLALTALAIHGGRGTDMRVTSDGLNLRNIGSPGQLISLMPNMGSTQEVTVDYAAGTADQMHGGLKINYIPREGGNTFHGSFFGTYVNDSLQGSNYSDALKAQGLGQPNALRDLYDFDGSGGGPIIRDKLWFYSGYRKQENSNYFAGLFYNLNAGNPNAWTYAPDLSRQAFQSTTQWSINTRLTWQATPKNKFSLYGEHQPRDNGSGSATTSPESFSDFLYPHNRIISAGWSSVISDRLLFDARAAVHTEELYNIVPPAGHVYRPAGEVWKTLVPVLEQGGSIPGLLYRGGGLFNGPSFLYSRQRSAPNLWMTYTSLSYVTGAHAFKVGFDDFWGGNINSNNMNDLGVSYRFNNGVPNLITEYATPNSRRSWVTEMALYAQDKWTLKKLTVNAGVRFDYFKTAFPEQNLGPGPMVPNRNITFPESEWYNWKDVTPRVGVAYDVFGTGKTAIRVNMARYVLAVDPTLGNPYFNLANLVTRSWNDANKDYVTNCDLLNPLANGECGTISDLRFGGLLPSTTTDPDTLKGWYKRPYDWEFSTSLQQQVHKRVGVDFGYFRRWYGNFTATDNRAVAPTDYSPFSITAPADSRLPNSGGYTVSNLFDLNPNKVGQVDNFVTFASNYGSQIEHWNGFDFNVNARLQKGVVVRGGLSTGRTSTDNCAVLAKLPEISPLGAPYCHVDTKFLTQIKLLGTYTIPRVDVRASATFQSLPGPNILANFTASNALIQPSLGRPLSGGAANATVNLVAPGTVYGDRSNELDLRFTKIFKLGRTRYGFNFDLYNALNASPVLTVNNSYSRWLSPLGILNPRLVKLSLQFDF